jgi:rubrerythrin
MVATPVSAATILDRCAELEARGIEFYRGMLRGAQTQWMRDLARMMVSAEERHRDRFRKYALRARTQVGEATEGPVPPDLQRLLQETVFMGGELAEKTAEQMNDRSALEAAIRHESNLALLFAQFRAYVPPDQRSFIDRIIKEEQEHEAKLASYRKKYFS